MIGYYNYTVILTYLSLVSAGAGIFVSLSGKGHPFIGILFLLICGLCDAFDGKVARTKKDRTAMECNYGIQVDSLSDIIAFGVLPACIGGAMFRCSPLITDYLRDCNSHFVRVLSVGVMFAILILYILAALIRLAYFNVTEEERQQSETGCRKNYTGLPVTSSALIFPTVLLLQFLTPFDITPVYFIIMIITGLMFISTIKVKKPGTKEILFMILIGAIEFLLIVILKNFF